MKLKIFALVALLLLPLSMDAQRKKKPVKKEKPAEEVVEDPRIAQMLASTQQIVFIDSMVVDKQDFMSYIPLSPHIGKLKQADGLGSFTSEMGDHRLMTTDESAIASTDFIGNHWTAPSPIKGIGSAPACNPFLMPDGITLYFAQKGEKSIGGYDIFVTRYDSEMAAFLRPENLGMPFSSESNDLFYGIDEFNQLGYFVTDRRQPHGKVCIYVFIPNEQRKVYRSEAYSEEQLRSLAAIRRIADTWKDKLQRQEALKRFTTARSAFAASENSTQKSQGQSMLDSLRHEADVLEKTLTLTRNRYATATEGERVTLRISILSAEQQLENLQLEIRQREKQIPYHN